MNFSIKLIESYLSPCYAYSTIVAIGSVFIARGVGAICGAVLSAKLYKWFYGNTVMIIALCILSFLLFLLPFVPSVFLLHVQFTFLGLGTAIVDTGCQIMTRKIHGKEAGPWLGANTVAFGVSGSLVPVIEFISDSLVVQNSILAGVSLLVAFLILTSPNPEAGGSSTGPQALMKPKGREVDVPHYHVEWIMAISVFWLIGGKVTATSYLDEYVEDTGVIPYSQSSLLITVLWVAITIGRLAGLKDQMDVTTPKLYTHLYIFYIGGTLSMILLGMFQGSAASLWMAVGFYGFFNGPCVGYVYDLNNRITIATEKSMSIVMFGLNFGASLVPYLMSLMWDVWGPPTLIVVILISMSIPIPLLHLTRLVSYNSGAHRKSSKKKNGGGGGSSRGKYQTVSARDLDIEENGEENHFNNEEETAQKSYQNLSEDEGGWNNQNNQNNNGDSKDGEDSDYELSPSSSSSSSSSSPSHRNNSSNKSSSKIRTTL